MKTRNLLLFIIFSIASFGCAQQGDERCHLDGNFFSDTILLDYEKLASRIVDYLSLCENEIKKTECHFESVNQILSLVSTEPSRYAYVVKGLIEVYSQTGYDKIVAYLSDFPFLPQDIDESGLQALKQFADTFQKVRVGAKAPEILYGMSERKSFSLYEFKSAFSILAFLSYDCNHCREWLRSVRPFLVQNSEYKLVVWDVSGNSRKMQRLFRRYHVEGAVCLTDDCGWKSPVVESYCVFTTPSVFVLDSEKTIVLKPETVDELYSLTNENQ